MDQIAWTTDHGTSTAVMATAPPDQHICYDPRKVQNVDLMDIDIATVTPSSWHPASFAPQARAADILSQRENSEPRPAPNMTLTKFGKKRAPIPNMLLHPESPHIDNTTSSGRPERSQLATVTSDGLSSPESPRTLRRTKKRLSLSGVARPTADNLAPPDPMIPLSPPPLPVSYQHDFSNIHLTPPNSPTGHQRSSGVANISPVVTYSPPTPPSPTRTSQGTQLSSPMSSPVLPRIGTHKRPYYSTVRASMNSRSTFDASPLSSPPTSPSSITFPTTSSARQSRSSASANFGRSETSLTTDQPSPTLLTYRSAAPYSNDNTQKSPIVTVPPLPPLLPPSPTSIPFQTRAGAPSPMRGILPVLDLTHDEDEDENTDYHGRFGMKVRLVKYLSTKKSGNSKEKVKNPSSSLSSRRRRGCSFGFGSDKGKEVVPPFPTLLTSRSFTGLDSNQGGSMSDGMELKMTLAERDINSGNENGTNSTPTFKFRENQRPSHDGREKSRGRAGGRKLVKARSSIELTSKLASGSSPTSAPSKPKIGFRLREMMGVSFLGKFQGNDTARS